MKVILDANVLYPAPVRDMLLSLANNKMFQPKWSAAINEEWVRNLVANRPDIKRENTENTIPFSEYYARGVLFGSEE